MLSAIRRIPTSPDDRYMLSDGNSIPCIGYGTWRVKDREDGARVCEEAVRAGYRHFDTAYLYGSEGSVGEAVRTSGLARSDFFVTTKVWKDDLSAEGARRELGVSLERLGLDYVDLLLIHWPRRSAEDLNWQRAITETWNAFQEFKAEGLVKSIGVANFLPHHFAALEGEVPVVNQIEVHPGYLQEEVIRYCRERGILVEAWAPLGQSRLMSNDTVRAIAEKHGVTPARVCLRFSLELGLLPIVKSANPERMRANRDVFNFALDDEDRAALFGLPEKTGWSGEHPDDAIPMPDFSKL